MSTITRIAVIVVGWTIAGSILAAQAWVSADMRDLPVTWERAFGTWLAWAYAWAVLTPIALWLSARFPRALLLHILAGPVFAALNLALFAAIVGKGWDWFGTFRLFLGNAYLLNVPVYWLLAAGIYALRIAQQARERERRALKLEAQLSEARLLALRAQLEPHFLFNALNTIAVLMREDVDAADRVLALLSRLLRRVLDAASAPEVQLRQEVEFLEAYLAIEQARFPHRLSFHVDVDPQLLDARVPSLILQPLVENAVRHGVAARTAAGRIEVAASREDEMLLVTVRDDGPGMADDAQEGIGLSNTRSRLELLYGKRHSFRLDRAEGGGLQIALAIPLQAAAAAT